MRNTLLTLGLVVLTGLAFAQDAVLDELDPTFGSLDVWWCNANDTFPNATSCDPTNAEWAGTINNDTTCSSYILKMWALDADSNWDSDCSDGTCGKTETYYCTTPGFEGVFIPTGIGECLWSCLFDNINTYWDGSPFTFATGDTLCIRIEVDLSDPSFESTFGGFALDSAVVETCMAWATDPGGVELHLIVQRYPTAAGVHEKIRLPEEPTLAQNSPNPFNTSTEISFTIPEGAEVKLEVTDVLGKHVATLVDGYREAGAYTVRWDGTDDAKNEVPSGVYFYKLTVGDRFIDKKKMTLLK